MLLVFLSLSEVTRACNKADGAGSKRRKDPGTFALVGWLVGHIHGRQGEVMFNKQRAYAWHTPRNNNKTIPVTESMFVYARARAFVYADEKTKRKTKTEKEETERCRRCLVCAYVVCAVVCDTRASRNKQW